MDDFSTILIFGVYFGYPNFNWSLLLNLRILLETHFEPQLYFGREHTAL